LFPRLVRWLLAATLAGSLLLPGVHAKEDGLWPRGTIRVYDASDWPQTVRLAIDRWNSAETGVRFELTHDRRSADVMVVSEPAEQIQRECPEARASECQAYSRVGYTPADGVARVVLPSAIPMVDKFHTPFFVRLTVHELGHVIGLRHVTNPCELMNPNVNLPRCPVMSRARPRRWLCGPTRGDAERAARMYGGRVPADFTPFCRSR
jgi:predicted Zn-dependent protease